MPERIVLDPTEVATNRTQLDVTDWVSSDGIDWGDAEIAAYMAEQERGSTPVDFRVPNRQITVPLKLQARGGTTFAQARSNIQAKVARIQGEGGWLKRVTASGGTVFADVVNATLKLGGSWMQAHRNADVEANLSMEAIPDFYGPEITLTDHVETTARELIFTETGIDGDYPARVRVVVDNDDTRSQLGLIWGFRSRHYSSAATARLAYEAEALTPISGTVSGGNVTSGTLGANWSAVLSTQIAGVGHMTHTGTYRVWARIDENASGNSEPWTRFVWDVGDMTAPVTNDPVKVVVAADALYDLGEIRLDPAPVGTHRWQGQIQGKSSDGNPSAFLVEKMWLVPIDEGYGVLRAPPVGELGLVAYQGKDEFRQTAGALNGKTAEAGGAWATTGGTTDFQVTGGTMVTRSVGTDVTQPRVATLNTNMGPTVVQADIRWDTETAPGAVPGIIARFIDLDNRFSARVAPSTTGVTSLTTSVIVGGTGFTDVRFINRPEPGAFYTLRALIDTAGRYFVWFYKTGSTPSNPLLSGENGSLYTAASLASGDVGLYDFSNNAASARSFKNFQAWSPIEDAVIHASRSLELRTDGIVRAEAGGTAYGPVPQVVGDLPRLPPAGLEGRTCEVFLKTSRGALEPSADSSADNISARVHYRPSWLFVPDS